jgi:hypothetical protein
MHPTEFSSKLGKYAIKSHFLVGVTKRHGGTFKVINTVWKRIKRQKNETFARSSIVRKTAASTDGGESREDRDRVGRAGRTRLCGATYIFPSS